ncbi:MAG: hypothetical protein ACM3RX_01830 [Methanococcaceae archaeon]
MRIKLFASVLAMLFLFGITSASFAQDKVVKKTTKTEKVVKKDVKAKAKAVKEHSKMKDGKCTMDDKASCKKECEKE